MSPQDSSSITFITPVLHEERNEQYSYEMVPSSTACTEARSDCQEEQHLQRSGAHLCTPISALRCVRPPGVPCVHALPPLPLLLCRDHPHSASPVLARCSACAVLLRRRGRSGGCRAGWCMGNVSWTASWRPAQLQAPWSRPG